MKKRWIMVALFSLFIGLGVAVWAWVSVSMTDREWPVKAEIAARLEGEFRARVEALAPAAG